jgi:hypothetical protein
MAQANEGHTGNHNTRTSSSFTAAAFKHWLRTPENNSHNRQVRRLSVGQHSRSRSQEERVYGGSCTWPIRGWKGYACLLAQR